MAFKVQRVSKARVPPVLAGFKDPEGKVPDQAQFGSNVEKPALPEGKPRNVVITDRNKNNSRSAYSYAGVEFRPLHVSDEGGMSTAMLEPSRGQVHNEQQTYERIDMGTGDIDDINGSGFSNQESGRNMNNRTENVQAFSSSVKKPPPIPKPYSKPKEVDDIDGGKKKVPPRLPKPYGVRKEENDEANKPQDNLVVDAVYAVVNKQSKSQTVIEKAVEPIEDEEPPPLPSRPNFELEEDIKKSQEIIAGEESNEVTEKSGKGFGLIKTFKKHMRKSSNDSVAAKKTVDSKEEVENDSKPTRPYLVTDIVNQPSSKMFGEPEMYESATDARDENYSSPGSNDLPEGWQEVKDAEGTYYWHVASGTTQWNKPQKLEKTFTTAVPRPNADQHKPKPKVELKKVTSFPVHSMGWVELEESQVAPHNMSDTIAECITNLALQRKDLRKTNETWGNGKDLRLLLVGDTLKLVDTLTKATILVQPISKMRVWGAGRTEQTDFAYVARDQTTGKHKCHVFRCHGAISGRTIHNKLHELCNNILAEKKKARENQQPAAAATRQWSDILNTPPKPSVKDQAGFNVKPVAELKKSFSAKYIGKVNVPKPSGIDILHKAIDFASNAVDPGKWQTCLIDITVSSVRSTDCMSQQVIANDRIKFVSFIGVAKEPRFCGYITSTDQNAPFTCHVFHCIPNAASFTRALEEACRLRLQSCMETDPELAKKISAADTEKAPEKESKTTTGIKGLFGKLAGQTKLGLKKTNSDASGSETPEQERTPEPPTPNQILIKYYGFQPVGLGTGPTPIKEAVQATQGTTLQISYITISHEGITLDDTVKSGLLRKQIMAEKMSYCALASDRVHFGVIESIGGGKFICHVFAEYKTPVNTVVEAINRTCL